MTGETEVENGIKWLVSFLQDAEMDSDYPCEFSIAKQEKEGKLSKRFHIMISLLSADFENEWNPKPGIIVDSLQDPPLPQSLYLDFSPESS